MTLAEPAWLLMLILLPIIATGAVLTARLRKKQWGAFVSERLRPRLLKRSSPIPRWIAFVCMLLASALLIIALSRPQSRRETTTETILGRNILFAIDLSRSMKVADLRPDRLTQAKAAAYELLDALPNDRIGVVGFAGSAYLFAPLTPDHSAIRETINQLDIDWIPAGGSNLKEGLKLAIETLKKTGTRQNALILMSDGEEHEGKISEIAQDARSAGIEVITIGFGTEQGDFVPDDEFADGRFRDREGKEVISRLETAPLKRVSEVTGGRFAIASSGADIPAMVQAAVSDLDKVRIAGREKVVTVEYFQWFVLPAILLLIGAAVAATRWRGVGTAIALLCFLPRPLQAGDVDDARAAYAAEHYEEARDRFGALAEMEPDQEKAFGYRLAQGNAAYRIGDLATARKAFSEALRADDSQLRNAAHHGMGNTLFEIGWARLSKGSAYPDPGPPPEESEEADVFDRLSDALLDRTNDERPSEGDLAAFEEMVKNRLDEWMKEETPEESQSEGSEHFNQLLTDWIDAVRHYDSTVAFEPAAHNRELTVIHLRKLREILEKVEENAQSIQAVPMPGSGEGEEPGEQNPGEGGSGEEEGEGEGGEEEGEGEGEEEGEEKNDGGDKDGEPSESDGEGGKKEPKPGETPEEAARRILNENADLQKGALSPGRLRFRRPDKDW
ncbi:VWA domain-containing protein [Haloferula chungangensis]|uniref:VWA domain-containing protein n=1 Tax=Haloferula chungangensis TaxID=1048331 RepID=A0ABW2L557_9BACT